MFVELFKQAVNLFEV